MLCIINIKTKEGLYNFSSLFDRFFEGELKSFHTCTYCDSTNYSFFILRKSLISADTWKNKIKKKVREEKERLAKDNNVSETNFKFEVSFVDSTDYIF